mgnify:CR=1 FL=1
MSGHAENEVQFSLSLPIKGRKPFEWWKGWCCWFGYFTIDFLLILFISRSSVYSTIPFAESLRQHTILPVLLIEKAMLQLMQTVIRLLLEVLRQMYRSCLLQNQVNILLGKPEGTAQAIKGQSTYSRENQYCQKWKRPKELCRNTTQR